MIEYMFLPLDRQYDSGFGAVADAFKDAADQLVASRTEGNKVVINGHLPINFLYRHSIELFLKSIIIIVHKRLRLPADDGSHQPNPKVRVGHQLKEIHQVHGIRDLYDCFKGLVGEHRDSLLKISNTDWSAVPAELDAWIATIDEADSGGTFFRYPMTKNREGDAAKSSFKEVTVAELLAQAKAGGKPAKFYLRVKNDEGNVVETFGLDHRPINELGEALSNAVELLSGTQFGMYAELVLDRHPAEHYDR